MSISATFGPTSNEASLRDYWVLTKPGVMYLVLFSGFTGLVLAPGSLHPLLSAITLLCIAAGSAGGAMINMWYDRDIDAVMRRTQKRPIPAGRVMADDVLVTGMTLSVFSVFMLGLAVNFLAAGILAFAIFFYAVIYTQWLKRSTSQNIVIGGAAGAFPPVIGWAAVTGSVDLYPMILFMIIFLWTPPHFWALALHRNSDYQEANIPMLPVTHGAKATKVQIAFYTVLLVLTTLLPAILGYTGQLYLVSAAALNAGFVHFMIRAVRAEDTRVAMKLFGYSILYLFLLFAALQIDALVA